MWKDPAAMRPGLLFYHKTKVSIPSILPDWHG